MNFYVRNKSKNKNIGTVLIDLNTLFSELFLESSVGVESTKSECGWLGEWFDAKLNNRNIIHPHLSPQ